LRSEVLKATILNITTHCVVDMYWPISQPWWWK